MAKRNIFTALLYRVDLYGNTFNFNIDGKEKINSIMGGVFSIITILATLALAIYNFINLVSTNAPILTTSFDYRDPSNSMVIKKDNISVGVGLYVIEKNANPIEFSLTGQSMKNFKRNLFDSSNDELVIAGEMKTCEKVGSNLLTDTILEKYKTLSSNIFCSDITSNVEIVSDSLDSGNVFDFSTNTEINLCSFDSNCKDLIHMKNKNAKGNNKLLIYYKDTFSDPLVESGIRSVIVTESIDLDYTVDYNVVFTVKENILETDKNFFLDFFPFKRTTFYSFIVNVWPKTKPEVNNPEIMKLNIKYILDKQTSKYLRTYQKADAFIANTYAIYGLIYVICSILLSVFDIDNVEFFIMNKIYTFFDGYSSTINEKKQNKESQIKVTEMNKVSRFEINDLNSKDLGIVGQSEVNLKSKNALVENESNKIVGERISIKKIENMQSEIPLTRNIVKLFLIKYLGCYKTSNYFKIYERASSYLENDFNIITLVKKLILFEKLNDHLDQNQKYEFEKRIINVNDE